MICPNCGLDCLSPCGACSNCRYSAPQAAGSFGKRRPALLIGLSLSIFIGLVASAAAAFYSLRKTTVLAGPVGVRKTQLPVQHGAVVRPEQLQGHGQLYLVGVGRQAIPVQDLADYYTSKFGIRITVLPEIEIMAEDCVPARHNQCVAELMMAEMTTAYPEIAREPTSVMIALTDEDIFSKERNWRFTYSWHSQHIGVISTRRMNPAFWGKPANNETTLAYTRQMLTKYIAMLYFHIPDSLDPSSVMFTPLTPNGGRDDIYESDLHPEASANGRRGTPYACLNLAYSYETDKVTALNPLLSDCWHHNGVSSRSEEIFEVNLGVGAFTERAMDFQLDTIPAITFRRGHNSGYSAPMELGLGWNTGHSLNAYLGSDSSQSYASLYREDGATDYFARTDHGRGFNPKYAFDNTDGTIYGARITWNSDHYQLTYRDGAVATFLPCNHGHVLCYWTGYKNAQGDMLRLDRTPNDELPRATATNGELRFKYNARHQIIDAVANNGEHVVYEYDDQGGLSTVHRTDGNIALYEYDDHHRMTSFTVLHQTGAPEKMLTIEYDPRGRVTRLTLAGVGSYSIEYLAETKDYASHLKITDPAGQMLDITSGQDDYIVRTTPIQFEALPGR